MSSEPQQRAERFVELTRTVIALLRYGPRELALAIGGFVALAVPHVLPDVDVPEAFETFWNALPAVLSLLGLGFLVATVTLLYRKATAPLPEPGETKPSALKGAAAFGPQDSELFSRLRRSAEVATLRGWVLDDQVPLVAVMGESGVGKTSLLRSGLDFNLRDADVQLLYWEALPADPAAALLESVRAAFPEGVPRPESLDNLLAADAPPSVVVIDQAEQLSPDTHPEPFAFLRRAVSANPPYRTTFVVAFRREYTATWRDFELELSAAERQRIETLSLKRFSRETANEVVATLVEASGLPIAQGVVTEIVGGVAEGGRVSPVDICISLPRPERGGGRSGDILPGAFQKRRRADGALERLPRAALGGLR